MSYCHHLDTCYLIEYLQHKCGINGDQPNHASEIIGHLLYRNNHELKVTEIGLGEALKVIADPTSDISADRSQMVNELYDLIRGNSNIKIHRPRIQRLGRLTDLVTQIRKCDPLMKTNDVIILAYSMEEVQCKGLLTFDSGLIENGALKNLVNRQIRNRRGYTISDRA